METVYAFFFNKKHMTQRLLQMDLLPLITTLIGWEVRLLPKTLHVARIRLNMRRGREAIVGNVVFKP